MKNITFSVIICAYNIEKYIGIAIDSVLKQDFQNYELIIFNDGSKDNTLNEVKKYKDKRIKVINSKKNIGLGAGRNCAVKRAKGEYILYLDGDDYLYEDKTLSKIYGVVERNKPDIAYFGVQYIGGDNKQYIPTEENSTKQARIMCDIHFAVSSKCWKREFLKANKITFVENAYYEDMIYSIKATILSKNITYGSFPIYCYVRDREGSIMSTPNIKRCSDMYRMLANIMDLYPITPDEYKPYLLCFIKQETQSLPCKVKEIVKAMKEGRNNPIFPKRHYTFDETDEEIRI